MRFSRLLLACLVAAVIPVEAQAATAILQGGPWAPGHAPMYTNSGNAQPVVQDSGPAGGGAVGLGMSEGLYVARGTGTPPYVAQGTGPLGTNWCDYDASITNAAGYHYLCLSPNAGGGGLITYGAGGSATALPLIFSINGVSYDFPAILSGVVGPSTSVVNDIACWNNTTGTILKDCGTPETYYAALYGTVCDGTTDDAGHINAAIAAATATGGVVLLPLGTCAVASTITIPGGVRLSGQGTSFPNLGVLFTPTYPTKLKWTGGNIASTVIQLGTTAASVGSPALSNLSIDGQIAPGGLSASQLKAVVVHSSLNSLIENLNIENVGTGYSCEPNYNLTGGATLVGFSTVRNVRVSVIGTAYAFSTNSPPSQMEGGCTNQQLINVMAYEYYNYGANFYANSDDNRFTGAYFTSTQAASVGIAYNTQAPGTAVGVYENDFINSEVECSTGNPAQASIHANVSNLTFGTTFQGGIFGCHAPVVAAGGKLTLYDDSSTTPLAAVSSDNARESILLDNVSTGSSAQVGLVLGNDVNSGAAYFLVNGSGNSSLGGATSLNIFSATLINFITALGGGGTTGLTANSNLAIDNATAIPAGGTAGFGYLFSSTANFGIFFGSGAPSLAAAKGSLYLRSDGSSTSTRMYVNTDGSTTWTAVTTAS